MDQDILERFDNEVQKRVTSLQDRMQTIKQEILHAYMIIIESLPDHIQSSCVGDVLLASLENEEMITHGSSNFSTVRDSISVMGETAPSSRGRRLRNTDSILSINGSPLQNPFSNSFHNACALSDDEASDNIRASLVSNASTAASRRGTLLKNYTENIQPDTLVAIPLDPETFLEMDPTQSPSTMKRLEMNEAQKGLVKNKLADLQALLAAQIAALEAS
ncbi:hypothetical protein SeMB42_g03185 [Synchytrium endobioticum]|uniref:Borealin N-terminal domain-containing protein n=1 Tax=Synchytrium endobioticum TaxID=286115 RepID=A0A507CXW0_9FUNG|nr:hypothetical protein SeLEV6574_g04738 [Synchytrium endobioticum]TPX47846.1 hypothetical protein SeMB42_g03185 [Synchytrium endobioticum]